MHYAYVRQLTRQILLSLIRKVCCVASRAHRNSLLGEDPLDRIKGYLENPAVAGKSRDSDLVCGWTAGDTLSR